MQQPHNPSSASPPNVLARPEYQLTASPAYRALWSPSVPLELFVPAETCGSPEADASGERSLHVVRRHRQAESLFGPGEKLDAAVVDELTEAGFWGFRVPQPFGGSGASLVQTAGLLTRVAAIEPAVAALASAHGCIGAVNALTAFGTPQQQQRWLPSLADGTRRSAFALTEPGAGTDISAVQATAVRQGDQFLLTGHKLFITDAAPGRLLNLVCRADGELAVLIVPLPGEENDQFRLQRYDLHALRHVENLGIEFNELSVSADDRLHADGGDARTIIYHGLNRGRMALCANAAGSIRRLLAGLAPWVRHRTTFGRAIGQRPLVLRRLGQMAADAVACDALARWSAALLDGGYRGLLECIVAKVFAAEALRRAATECALPTHGGRALLGGHPLGDRLYDLLAPAIYEGENEMLLLAMFAALLKYDGCVDSSHATLPGPACDLSGAAQTHIDVAQQTLDQLRAEFRDAAQWDTDRREQRQCHAVEMARRFTAAVALTCIAVRAEQLTDPIERAAADLASRRLARQLKRTPVDNAELNVAVELGREIVAGSWASVAELPTDPIVMPVE